MAEARKLEGEIRKLTNQEEEQARSAKTKKDHLIDLQSNS